jgi:hypothetical protein
MEEKNTKMTELKTLKDWRDEISTLQEFKEHRMQIFRCEEWLRAEAVKWFKMFKANIEVGASMDYGVFDFIPKFFNLTSEDLA